MTRAVVEGRIRIAQGNWSAAEQLLRESAALNQATDHQTWLALSVAGLGRIAAARGQMMPAARALDAIDAHFQTNSIKLDADDQVEWDQLLTTVRAAMPHEVFNSALDAGRAWTRQERQSSP